MREGTFGGDVRPQPVNPELVRGQFLGSMSFLNPSERGLHERANNSPVYVADALPPEQARLLYTDRGFSGIDAPTAELKNRIMDEVSLEKLLIARVGYALYNVEMQLTFSPANYPKIFATAKDQRIKTEPQTSSGRKQDG